MAELVGIIPASGRGERFGGAVPKQFLPLAGRPLVDHAIAALLADARIGRVHVLCAPDLAGDVRPGASLAAGLAARVQVHRRGGATRAATVAMAASMFAGGDAWLVVHDAVRPCLHAHDLRAVLDATASCSVPALLAEPLRATLKQVADGQVTTLPRAGKWLAQTPQVASAAALHAALAANVDVTDEAQALELAGSNPVLVASRHPNPKVTTPADLEFAAHVLASRQGGAPGTGT